MDMERFTYFWRKIRDKGMRSPFFRFKQFTIWHDRCAMKVGTDGVLLGAWVSLRQVRNVLDIGTGSGLIALMIAQRCPAQVTGIDIDSDAIGQAGENALASPWSGRIRFCQADAGAFQGGVYDTIVSNPPYFRERVHCPDGQRNAARHTESLTFECLLDAVARLMSEDGSFSVILPAEAGERFITLAAERHLYLLRRTYVHTKPSASPKRVLMTFVRTIQACETTHLTLEESPKVYSREYIGLVGDFYLNINA